MLEVNSIYLYRNKRQIFNNFTLNLKNKEIILITGDNGVGKTSLLDSISGLIEPQRGSVKINGFHVSELGERKKKSFLYLPHKNCLKENLTINENLESWFDRFFKNLTGVPRVEVSKGVLPISISGGPYKGKPNPHAWMSIKNALVYVDNIRLAMVEFDSENTEIYNANAKLYSSQIIASLEPLSERLAKLPKEKRWLVTSEGAFSYLARDHSLQELFLWPINSDGQGTPQQVRRVIDGVRRNQIKAVFSESTVSSKPARQIARETGANYAGILYVDSLSGSDGPVPTYIDLMKITLLTIADGLDK